VRITFPDVPEFLPGPHFFSSFSDSPIIHDGRATETHVEKVLTSFFITGKHFDAHFSMSGKHFADVC